MDILSLGLVIFRLIVGVEIFVFKIVDGVILGIVVCFGVILSIIVVIGVVLGLAIVNGFWF